MWMVTPRPRGMKPPISSPGSGAPGAPPPPPPPPPPRPPALREGLLLLRQQLPHRLPGGDLPVADRGQEFLGGPQPVPLHHGGQRLGGQELGRALPQLPDLPLQDLPPQRHAPGPLLVLQPGPDPTPGPRGVDDLQPVLAGGLLGGG